MRRKYETIIVTPVAPSWFKCWTRCDGCGDEIARELMYWVNLNVDHPMSPNSKGAQYCKKCAPTEEDARGLFDKTFVNPPRPTASPPPQALIEDKGLPLITKIKTMPNIKPPLKPRSTTGESK